MEERVLELRLGGVEGLKAPVDTVHWNLNLAYGLVFSPRAHYACHEDMQRIHVPYKVGIFRFAFEFLSFGFAH